MSTQNRKEHTPTQKQRFIDAAKEAEADETGEAFEKAFGKIVPPVKRDGKPSNG